MPIVKHERRRLLRWAGQVAAAHAVSLLAPSGAAAQSRSPDAAGARRLVAFYSRTGHTRQAALVIARAVGAELFEIEPAVAYPAAYQDTVDLNVRQRDAGVYPDVARLVPDLAAYDTVFVGYPIWAVDLPRLLVPFLRRQDWAGKTLAPFCTSAFSGLGATERTLQRLCPGARVVPGLALPGGARGHNTWVDRIAPDAERAAEAWARQSWESAARRASTAEVRQ